MPLTLDQMSETKKRALTLDEMATTKPEPSLMERFGKQLWNRGVADILHTLGKSDVSYAEIEAYETQNKRIAQRKAKKERPFAGQFLEDEFQDIVFQLQKTPEARESDDLRKLPYYPKEEDIDPFALPVIPAKTVPEKVIDVGIGLATFIAQLAIAKKALPIKTPTPAVWETVSLSSGGKPGEGAAMAVTLGTIGKIPTLTTVGKLTKLGTQSGLFAGIAAISGGETEDIIMAALTPLALQALTSTKGRITDARLVKSWKQNLPFMRDVPQKTCVKAARAIRAAYTAHDPKHSPEAKQRLYQQWNKIYGKDWGTFTGQASEAWAAAGGVRPPVMLPGQVAEQPFPRPVPAEKPLVKRAIVTPAPPTETPTKPSVVSPAAIKPAVEGRRGVLYEKDKGLYDETKPEEQVRISTLTEEGKQEALDFGEQLEEGTVLESADGSTHHLVGSQFVLSFDAETGKFLVASQKTTGGRAMNYDPDLSTINIFARSRVVGNKGKETDSVLSFSKSEAKPTKVAPEVAQRELKTPIPENKQLAEIRKQIDAAYRNKEVEVLADIIENKLDPLPATFEKNVLQGHAQVLQMDMEARLEEVAKPLLKKKVIAKPEIVEPAKATKGQIAQAHIIAKEKAFVSEKGKMRPGYRRLAKAMSGETSMKKMSSEQASRFIDALKRLPEPTYRKGKLVPPSIPRTTKLATLKQFQRKYRKPTLLKYITSQTYYAEVLGVKEIVRPLEEGKQRFDLEFRKASLEVDRKIDEIDKFYETTIKEKAAAKLKNQPTKAVAKIRDLLDKYEEPPKGLTIEEAQIFNWFRDLNREVLRRENEVRKALDYPLIKERKAYVRHVADVMATEMLQGKYPFPEGKAYWAQKAVSQKIYNPMEFQRKLAEEIEGLFTKDLGYATKSMLWTGLKEIHLSKPLRFFSEQLGAISKDLPIYKGLSPQEIELLQKTVVMPVGTKRWVIDYVNQVIKGQETWLDTQVNNLVTESGLSGLFNKILKPFGRTISRKPITNMFQKGGRLVISGVLGWRPKLLIRNKFQSFQNLALYTTKANLKGTIPASKQLREIIDNSLFIKGYTGFEELPKDLMGKMERAWLAPYQWTAVSNAVQAMKTAYWDTMELITKPKYKEFGWSDPKRTYKEKPEFLYPSEKKKMIREMELGAGATQYQYIPLGMPEAFRHKALIPFTRLQSWWMNHFAKFHREAGHRLIKGEPMWSDGTVKLPWSRRLGWFRYLIIGGLVLNTLGYTRSFLFGAAPTALPPAGQLALSSYFYLTSFFMAGSEEWKKWQREKAKKQIHNALLTFIPGYLAYRDYEAIWSGRKNLKSLFFYEKLKKKKKKIIISARRKELRGY